VSSPSGDSEVTPESQGEVLAISGCGASPDGLEVELLEHEISDLGKITLFFQLTDCASGRPAAYMDAEEDFQVFENGLDLDPSETYQSLQPSEQAFDFDSLILLDMSGSIVSQDNTPYLVEAASTMVSQFSDGRRFAVAIFDGRPDIEVLIDFTSDTEAVLDTIESLEDHEVVDFSTNLYGGIMDGLDLLDEQKSENDSLFSGSLLVFTDGRHYAGTDSGGEYSNFDEVVAAIEGSGLALFTIGLGQDINQSELSAIGKNGFVYAQDVDDLLDAFDSVAQSLKDLANSYYAFSYCSAKRTGDNELRLEAEWNNHVGYIEYGFNAAGFSGDCRTR
jgi:hypothetical protein